MAQFEDLKSKFIVVNNCIILGRVVFHKQILQLTEHSESKPDGGGEYILDSDKRVINLFGSSHDFGTATREQILYAVSLGNVGTRNRPQYFKNYKIIFNSKPVIAIT